MTLPPVHYLPHVCEVCRTDVQGEAYILLAGQCICIPCWAAREEMLHQEWKRKPKES